MLRQRFRHLFLEFRNTRIRNIGDALRLGDCFFEDAALIKSKGGYDSAFIGNCFQACSLSRNASG